MAKSSSSKKSTPQVVAPVQPTPEEIKPEVVVEEIPEEKKAPAGLDPIIMTMAQSVFWPELKGMIESYELEETAILRMIKQSAGDDFKATHFALIVIATIVLGMWAKLGSNVLVFLFGFIYPAYQSIKAISSKGTDDDTQWLTYWVVFSGFTVIEFGLDIILHYLPFYYLLKLVIVGYLAHPTYRGADKVYRAAEPLIKMLNNKVEEVEEEILEEIKASESSEAAL